MIGSLGSRSLAVAIVLAAVIVAVMTIFLVVDARSRAEAPSMPSAETASAKRGQEVDAVRSPSIPIDAARTDLRPALPALTPGPEVAGDGLRVRVIDGRTNAPVAGATVMLLDRSSAVENGRYLAEREGLDRRESLERFAEPAVTDSDGVARFDWPRGPATLSCEHAGLYGEHEIRRAPATAIELVLQPDEVVLVRVLDAQGAAAPGVGVSWVEESGGSGFWPLASAVTRAPDGIAVLEHTQLVRRQDELARTFVTPSLLLAEALLVPVDDERPSDGVLDIKLPELGSLECRILHAEGQPAVDWYNVSLRISARLIESMQSAGVRSARYGVERRAQESRFVFEHVGLGLELELDYGTDLHPGGAFWMQGPREPGERVTVDLPASTRDTSFQARVLDVDGTPLRWRALGLRLGDRSATADSAPPPRRFAYTDAGGLIREALPVEGPQDMRFRLEIDVESPSAGKRASAGIDFSAPPSRTTFDLGNVSLELDPVMVAGRVVDETGAPIPWASVWAEPVRERDSVVSGLESSPDPGAYTRSDALGRFEVRSHRAPMRLHVYGQHEEHADSRGVEALLGTDDVVLVLSSTGSIAGRAILAPEARPMLHRLTLELTPNSSTQARHSWQNDGSFRFSQIAPGTYDLTLRFAPELAELGHWEDLEVRATETLRDERLAAIDLRASLRVLTIALTAPDGEPVRDGQIQYRKSGDPGDWLEGAGPLSAGRHAVVTTHAEIDLRIDAPGFAPREVDGISSDRRIELDRGPAVRVILGGALPRIGSKWRLGVLLQLQDPMRRAAASANAVLDASGVARPHVSVTGTYAVVLTLERTCGGYGWQTFNPFADQRFTLDGLSAEHLIELPALESKWIQRIERTAFDDQ